MSEKNMKEVWTVCDRGQDRKPFWLRVGTAFENKDGSWSLMLDALPVNGKLIMRDQREREDRPDSSPRRAAPRASSRARDDGPDYGGDDRDLPF